VKRLGGRMAEHKKSFILYADLIHTVKKMPPDQAGKLFMTILEYVNDMNPVLPETDLLVDLVFEPIKQQLKRDLTAWDEVREKRSDAGKASVEARRLLKKLKEEQVESLTDDQALSCIKANVEVPPKSPELTNLTCVESVQQTSTNLTVSVNGTVTVNDTVTVTDKIKDITAATQSGDLIKSKDVFNSVKEFFNAIYKDEFKTEYYFDAKDAAKLKSIIKKVHFKIKETDQRNNFTIQELTEATQFFIQATLSTADVWLKSNFSLSIIDTKFNDIYSSMKNLQNGITKTKRRSIFED
jgi:hypothetical protein